MADQTLIDEWLDRWEELYEQGVSLPLDEFVARHCQGASAELVQAFRDKVGALLSIDARLAGKGREDTKTGNTTGDGGQQLAHDLHLKPGCEPVEGYSLADELGRGGFGEVWKAIGPGGFPIALKFVRLGRRVGRKELRALELLKNVRHPNIISIFGSWQKGDYLIIAMDLADSTLMDRLDQAKVQGSVGIPSAELLQYMVEAAKALDYLNEPRHPTDAGDLAAIIHRDVKPHNILIVGGSVKLADLGLARVLEQTIDSHSGGRTPLYAAPEFFDDRTARTSDQYSLAVTYYQLRTGKLPYSGSTAKITRGHIDQPPDLSALTEEEQRVVARALAKDPKNRWPNCGAFVDELRKALPLVGARKEALDHWEAHYTLRLERELTDAWPDLAEHLERIVGVLKWSQVPLGPRADFREQSIRPIVKNWIRRHVQPILEEAEKDLRKLTRSESDNSNSVPRLKQGDLEMLQPWDRLMVKTMRAGPVLSCDLVALGIIPAIEHLVFTTMLQHWAMMVNGVWLDDPVAFVGFSFLFDMKARLQTSFRNRVAPKIRVSLIGEGIELAGTWMPSLLVQLKQKVKATAEEARRRLDQGR